MRISKILVIVFSLFYSLDLFSQQTWNEELITTPEKSNFIKTSTHEDVMKFLNVIQGQSKLVHIFSMGKSLEGTAYEYPLKDMIPKQAELESKQ